MEKYFRVYTHNWENQYNDLDTALKEAIKLSMADIDTDVSVEVVVVSTELLDKFRNGGRVA